MRTFTDSISILRHGELADELSTKLAETIAACKASGRTSEFVLKLKIKPGKGGQVEVFDDVIARLPTPERSTSIVFIGPDNESLQREDPRQRSLPNIRTVAEPVDAPIREVGKNGA